MANTSGILISQMGRVTIRDKFAGFCYGLEGAKSFEAADGIELTLCDLEELVTQIKKWRQKKPIKVTTDGRVEQGRIGIGWFELHTSEYEFVPNDGIKLTYDEMMEIADGLRSFDSERLGGTARTTPDLGISDVSEVHSRGNHDAPGQSSEHVVEPGDTLEAGSRRGNDQQLYVFPRTARPCYSDVPRA